ncbi:MAG: ATP-binding protein [Acidimicrobiales bacterium]
MVSVRKATAGSAAAVVLVAAFGAVMFPFRGHLSVATAALVFVVPVLVSVAGSGFVPGVVATATGFIGYDLVFIPPYYTLSVGAAQNWVALGVYAVVMVVASRVVAQLTVARAEALGRAAEVRRMFDLSELLVRGSSVPELLDTIVSSVQQAFDLEGAALLLPADGHLELVASTGLPLSEAECHQLSSKTPVPVSLDTASVGRGGVQAVALSASGQAIGLLALRGLPASRKGHELLRAFVNHLALALERAQLHEQAVQAQALAEVDRLRRSLVGAVSHDLRTPLATIKVSTSTLLDDRSSLSAGDAKELVGLIDAQAGRLDRLVSNLLDMTRIQSGALELRRRPTAVVGLVEEALAVLGSSAERERVKWRAVSDLPLVDVDPVLICQVLANLIDNATRHAPEDTPVTVSAVDCPDGSVEVSVTDRGPGVPPDERASIFHMFNRREAGGRGGLGLAIAHAFVEVHGGRIWVDGGRHTGARFVFTLPVAGPEKVS